MRDAVTQAGGNLVTVAAVHEPLDLNGLAHEAAGTPYAALATQPGLVSHFGVRIARQLVGSDHRLLARLQGKLLTSFDGQLEGLEGLVVVRNDPEGMTPVEAKVTEEFEVALVEGATTAGVPAVGVELSSTNPSQITWYRAPGHLKRRRPRYCSPGARRWHSRSPARTVRTGKSRPPNLVCCRGWPAGHRCREDPRTRVSKGRQPLVGPSCLKHLSRRGANRRSAAPRLPCGR